MRGVLPGLILAMLLVLMVALMDSGADLLLEALSSAFKSDSCIQHPDAKLACEPYPVCFAK